MAATCACVMSILHNEDTCKCFCHTGQSVHPYDENEDYKKQEYLKQLVDWRKKQAESGLFKQARKWPDPYQGQYEQQQVTITDKLIIEQFSRDEILMLKNLLQEVNITELKEMLAWYKRLQNL